MARNTSNRLEKRALLYNQMADERATRVAAAWNEQPAESVNPTPQQVHAMWNFSPSQNPQADFWAIHDQTLQQAVAQLGPNPKSEDVQAAYQQAELTALQQVYPWRLKVAPVMGLEPDMAVQKAHQVFGIVQRVQNGGQANANT
jgi:hypothetical protein